MKSIDVLAAVLVVAGALNWGLVGLFRLDLAAAPLGDGTALTRLLYTVVGAAGVYLVLQWKAIQQRWMGHAKPKTA